MKRVPLITLVLWCLALPACREKPTPDKNALKSAARKTGKLHPNRLDRDYTLAWNLKVYVEGYEQYGSRDPKWDEPAKQALTTMARVKVFENEPGYPTNIVALCGQAREAGWDDPLIEYLYARCVI